MTPTLVAFASLILLLIGVACLVGQEAHRATDQYVQGLLFRRSGKAEAFGIVVFVIIPVTMAVLGAIGLLTCGLMAAFA